MNEDIIENQKKWANKKSIDINMMPITNVQKIFKNKKTNRYSTIEKLQSTPFIMCSGNVSNYVYWKSYTSYSCPTGEA